MSWNLLERFINSEHFNKNAALSVAYLSRYADHVGIHYVLCFKLRQFPYDEIEFFLPQLCHLLVSVDNESMALEEFIIELCEESVNGALLTFWLFSSYLHDLSTTPKSNSFRTCRRIYNKVQQIIFGGTDLRREKVTHNVLPVTVLASITLASIAAPFLPRHAGPLAIAQARKPRPVEDVILEAPVAQKLGRSQTITEVSTSARRPGLDGRQADATAANGRIVKGNNVRRTAELVSDKSSRSQRTPVLPSTSTKRPSLLAIARTERQRSTSSLPELLLLSPKTDTPPWPDVSSPGRSIDHTSGNHPAPSRPSSPATLSREERIQLLRTHYFRSETQFLTALVDVSNRLVNVVKPARLSALRAELALIAQDLPAEVDIPVISPAVLEDGSPGRSKHHRVVRLNPAEATSLNSAEKVPYLLMLEILREDFDFDADSEANQRLLGRLLTGKGGSRRLFDFTDTARANTSHHAANDGADNVFESANGDLSNVSLIKDPASAEPSFNASSSAMAILPRRLLPRSARCASGANTRSSLSAESTPVTSDIPDSRASSPGPRRQQINRSSQQPGQPDFAALATHMRTAAQMLAQLELSGSKRPKDEVASIKAKIIASMQSLEEQSFFVGDVQAATFDTIMANANAAADVVVSEDLDDEIDRTLEPSLNSGAGAARMENDEKTGGVQRQGDRDDPSAATFGEEWTVKKERIRRSSPYGWMKNWDLLSVIVKTGADLRQEAFACQLIHICSRIWQEAGVPVWVKRLRILVTGHSSGLIETITNGVSVHSLKRSLTLATIASGKNPRKRIATLKDHFIKTFGEPDTSSYKGAADAFARSLAAYSIVAYILQIKDRHNGNILFDTDGHVIHIDFGFMLSNTPGSMGFEAAPFKLTQEYVDVLGGVGSPSFDTYKSLCKQAFQALRKSAENIIMLVELMGRQSTMPCFSSGVAQTTSSLRQRFQLQLGQEEAERFVETDLIGKSLGSYYTRLYDTFQYRTQGIY